MAKTATTKSTASKSAGTKSGSGTSTGTGKSSSAKTGSTAKPSTTSKTSGTSATASKRTTATKSTSSKSTSASKVKPKQDAAESLREFLVDGLKDIYWAEKALVKNLPKMAKNATSPNLQQAIEKHLAETENQVSRLEKVFSALGEKAKAEKCDAMDGLLKEAEGIMKETEPGPVRDAAIIAAAQKVEHYEIASYGTLATYCKLLEEPEALQLLVATLDEEKNCDLDLTDLAVSEINLEAK